VDLPVDVFSHADCAPHQVFEARIVNDPYQRCMRGFLLLTSSVNDQLPCCSTNVHRSDVGHIFVGHSAGTDKTVAFGLVVIDLLDLVLALGNEVLDRSDTLDLRNLERGRFTARLDG
jgi:hypothetical protein